MAAYDVVIVFDLEVDQTQTDRSASLVSIELASVLPVLDVKTVKVEAPTP